MKRHDYDHVRNETGTDSAEHAASGSDATATAGPLTPEEHIHHLEEQLAAKTRECGENWDRFLRERADLEN